MGYLSALQGGQVDSEEIDPEKLAAAQELARRMMISFLDELGDCGYWALATNRGTMPLETLRADLVAGEIAAQELAARVVARCRFVEGLLG